MWHISGPVFSRLPWCWLSWSPPKSSPIPSLKEDFIITDVTWPAVRISSTIHVIKAEDSSLLPLRTKDHHVTVICHSYQYKWVQLHNKQPAKKYSQREICGRWAHYRYHVVSWHVFILTQMTALYNIHAYRSLHIQHYCIFPICVINPWIELQMYFLN